MYCLGVWELIDEEYLAVEWRAFYDCYKVHGLAEADYIFGEAIITMIVDSYVREKAEFIICIQHNNVYYKIWELKGHYIYFKEDIKTKEILNYTSFSTYENVLEFIMQNAGMDFYCIDK